ncbi:triose-phosphate isomerase [Pseudoruegeria sp. HB172150]|uniref:triose-phosphate isomerase n=1 Tax=Pseudoruegeria sp. HB172150 TaxID=2721164 RepID=UPI0015540AEA|nr:triose-phosphate isomerase [Pseudoruegeria sp. HB172150]
MPPKKLAAGNWKMNGLKADLAEVAALAEAHATTACEILICPPATLLAPMAATVGSAPILLGGQNCHAAESGAHTGDISAAMLKDAGAGYVILGHSERRADHGETDAEVRIKTGAAWTAGLTAIVCIGETLSQREAGETLDIVGGQLDGSLPDGSTAENMVVAYEPVWAIGTGKVPTTVQIAEVHDFLRAQLVSRFGDAANGIRLLYGGSVKPSNAAEIFAVSNVDGALVGGASLKAADFGGIIDALAAA